MKVIHIIILIIIICSFGLSQDSPKQVNENKNIYNEQKAEKVKSDKKMKVTSNSENSIQNSNIVDLKKSKQKIEVRKMDKESIKTKDKKSFGSAKTSGQKQILEEKAVDDATMNTDAKEKVKKLLKKRVEVKKTD